MAPRSERVRPPPDVPEAEKQVRQHASVRLAPEAELAEEQLTPSPVSPTLRARAGLSICLTGRRGAGDVAKLLRRFGQGLMAREPQLAINLTDAGRALPEASRHRHPPVLSFLLALGVRGDGEPPPRR